MTGVTHADKRRIGALARDVLVAEFGVDAWFGGPRALAGTSPIGGRYPAPGFDVWFALSLEFPPDVSDAVEPDPTPALVPFVEDVDRRTERVLAAQGFTEVTLQHPWNRELDTGQWRPFVLACHLPPIFDDDYSRLARNYFRPVSAVEIDAFESAGGAGSWSPFSDEQWVMTRYAGINLFRAARWCPR